LINHPLVQGFEDTLAVLRTELPRIYERPSKAEKQVATRDKSKPLSFRKCIDDLAWKPKIFRWSEESERGGCLDLIEEKPQLQIIDTLSSQIRDLVRSRCPGQRLSPAELASLSSDHLKDTSVDEYGVWVYYPWSEKLVHLLDRDEFAELRTDRN